jgi:hypothetical protein
MQLDWCTDFFTPFYLDSCVWTDVISQWIWQRNIKFCAHLGRKAFGEESMSCTLKVETHWDLEVVTLVKSKAKSMIIIFFGIRGIDCSQVIRPDRPSSQFRLLLWQFTETAWKCAKTSPRTSATKELAVALCTVSHFHFHRGIFLPNTWLWSGSPIEDKSERPPFWHNWGDWGRITGGAEHPHWTTLRVMLASRPKVSVWPVGSTSPLNYGWLFV